MTCYVTNYGAIKLDNHVVGRVWQEDSIEDPGALSWHWNALVNGRYISSASGDPFRWVAVEAARSCAERESAVIR